MMHSTAASVVLGTQYIRNTKILAQDLPTESSLGQDDPSICRLVYKVSGRLGHCKWKMSRFFLDICEPSIHPMLVNKVPVVPAALFYTRGIDSDTNSYTHLHI